jgi:hypothetical protein
MTFAGTCNTVTVEGNDFQPHTDPVSVQSIHTGGMEGGRFNNNQFAPDCQLYLDSGNLDIDIGPNWQLAVAGTLGWRTTAFLNDFGNTTGEAPVGFRRHSDGTVELRSVTTKGTAGTGNILQLPDGFRPASPRIARFTCEAEDAGGSRITVRVAVTYQGYVVAEQSVKKVWLDAVRFTPN